MIDGGFLPFFDLDFDLLLPPLLSQIDYLPLTTRPSPTANSLSSNFSFSSFELRVV